jgi:hypothetical protein
MNADVKMLKGKIYRMGAFPNCVIAQMQDIYKLTDVELEQVRAYNEKRAKLLGAEEREALREVNEAK